MNKAQKKHLMNAIRTKIAFIFGDKCHGGPDRSKEMEELKQQLRELEQVEIED